MSWGDAWNAVKGVGHAVAHPLDTLHQVTNAVGITHDAPKPTPEQLAATQALSQFAGRLSNEYDNYKNGVTPTVAPVRMDTTQSDQSRQTQQGAIGDLQGVASGATPTAADALLTRGTDAASKNAMGMAAQYSAGNTGDALRKGLAASGDAFATAASAAAMQKANEQAAARGQLVDAANSMRGQDIGVAGANQTAGNEAQKANQSADLAQQQIDAQRQNQLRTATGASLAAPLAAAQAQQQLIAQNNAANGVATGGVLGDIAKAISDERLKTGVRDGSHEADTFLDSLAPRSYEWKSPADPRTTGPGEHLGVMAQDLPPRETGQMADGTKYIKPEVVSSILAGMGRMHDRLMAVEGKKKPEDDVKWGPSPYPRPYKPSSDGGARG